jgi:hypothetical protein
MRYTLLAACLVAVALAPRPVAAHERAARTDAAGSRPRGTAPVRDPAAVLSDLQQWLGVMSGALEPTPDAITGLDAALNAARSRPVDPALVRTLATSLGIALVAIQLDEESLERLAQNLHAALHSRAMTGREVGLLVGDTVSLLGQWGVEPPLVERVTRALIATCPVPPDAVPSVRQATGPAVLTRR